ncbi:MAG: hypothetical protein NC132_06555 [Corallococcus sp.]|nr:hypothetical protein [Corallococcus sp.]MCM1395745.1 hypothetical protein [Corallococcus sp.]
MKTLSNLLAFASVTWTDVQNAMKSFFDSIFTPLIIIMSSVVVIWGVFVGFKFWQASGDENKLKEAKKALVNLIIGTVVMFLVAVVMPLVIQALSDWMTNM